MIKHRTQLTNLSECHDFVTAPMMTTGWGISSVMTGRCLRFFNCMVEDANQEEVAVPNERIGPWQAKYVRLFVGPRV